MSVALLDMLAGFLGAMIALGIPTAKVLYDTRTDAARAVRLLTGEEEVEGDGVIPRLREVEKRSVEHRVALREHDGVDVPDLDGDEPVVTDGGRRADD